MCPTVAQRLRAELDAAKTTVKNQATSLKQLDAEHRRALAHTQLEYETKIQVCLVPYRHCIFNDRTQGLLPSSVQKELEDTIYALKDQVWQHA